MLLQQSLDPPVAHIGQMKTKWMLHGTTGPKPRRPSRDPHWTRNSSIHLRKQNQRSNPSRESGDSQTHRRKTRLETRCYNQRSRCAGTNSQSEGQREKSNYQTPTDMTLAELPTEHPLRNTQISKLNVAIVCKHTKTTRNPNTWKIKANTYNELGNTWHSNFNWEIKP